MPFPALIRRCAVSMAVLLTALVVAGTTAAAITTFPEAADNGAAKQALRHFTEQVSTFTADFTQTQTDDSGKILRRQSGQVWLQRATPEARSGRFRWAYEKPYKQLIVFDGTRIWVYDPDLKQVTVRPAGKAFAGSPAALLSARTTLTDAFSVQGAGKVDGQQRVELVPKDKQSDFKSVTLLLADGVPTRMVFRDHLGDITDVRFSHVQTNVKIPATRFVFVPPKGVTVVGANAGGG